MLHFLLPLLSLVLDISQMCPTPRVSYHGNCCRKLSMMISSAQWPGDSHQTTNTSSSQVRPQPIRAQYPGHVITLDQSEARVQKSHATPSHNQDWDFLTFFHRLALNNAHNLNPSSLVKWSRELFHDNQFRSRLQYIFPNRLSKI